MADHKGFEPKYDDQKNQDTIYFAKANRKADGTTYRKVELLLEEDTTYLSAKACEDQAKPIPFGIREDVTLFETNGGQQKIQCWLLESLTGKHVEAVHISRRTSKGVYGSQEITLSYKGLCALRDFVNSLSLIDTLDRMQMPITHHAVVPSETGRILSDQEFAELIKANIHSTEDFFQLLSIQKMELAIGRLKEIIDGDFKNEITIQQFLKENIWMLGNDYVFVVENGRINSKNILDIVPRNFESYIDIVEVKLPTQKLFVYDDSHNNYYSSAVLTKAIAQTQNYIYELEIKAQDAEYQQTNSCAIVRPKGIILIGSKEPLSDAERQYLRILNSSYHNLQVVTYQQLLAKAENTLGVVKARRV